MIRYNITVTTLITQGQQKPLLILRDVMTFGDVGEEVKDFIAGSCATTLQKFMRLPEDISDNAYHVTYQTQVFTTTGERIKTLTDGQKRLTGMDKDGVHQFMDWAIQELRETANVIQLNAPTLSSELRKRNKWKTLFSLMFSSGG